MIVSKNFNKNTLSDFSFRSTFFKFLMPDRLLVIVVNKATTYHFDLIRR